MALLYDTRDTVGYLLGHVKCKFASFTVRVILNIYNIDVLGCEQLAEIILNMQYCSVPLLLC